VIKVHDIDGNRQLDRAEFADYITSFVHQAGYDLDQVIDYLITLTQEKVGLGGDELIKKQAWRGGTAVATRLEGLMCCSNRLGAEGCCSNKAALYGKQWEDVCNMRRSVCVQGAMCVLALQRGARSGVFPVELTPSTSSTSWYARQLYLLLCFIHAVKGSVYGEMSDSAQGRGSTWVQQYVVLPVWSVSWMIVLPALFFRVMTSG
jgi:hypothetical protein